MIREDKQSDLKQFVNNVNGAIKGGNASQEIQKAVADLLRCYGIKSSAKK